MSFQSLHSTGAAPAPISLIRSRDGERVVAVRMDDALRARCWGFLIVSTPDSQPTEVLSEAEATAWVERERKAGQVSTKDRFAALRAATAPARECAA